MPGDQTARASKARRPQAVLVEIPTFYLDPERARYEVEEGYLNPCACTIASGKFTSKNDGQGDSNRQIA